MNYETTPQPDHAAYVQAQLERDGEDKDWEVVIAGDYMLMLDFDQPDLPPGFLPNLEILEQAVRQTVQFTTTNSRSGNKHVIVHLPFAMPIFERIAWQAALGSDPKREALHLLAVLRDEKHPIVLVMPKVKNLLSGDSRPLLTEGAADAQPSASIFADIFAGASEAPETPSELL